LKGGSHGFEHKKDGQTDKSGLGRNIKGKTKKKIGEKGCKWSRGGTNTEDEGKEEQIKTFGRCSQKSQMIKVLSNKEKES